MSFDKNYQDGLQGRAYSGTDFVAREMYRSGRNKRFDFSGNGGGDGGGAALALVALPVIAFILALTPVAGIVALVATQILLRRHPERGWNRGELFWPTMLASFPVVAIFVIVFMTGRGLPMVYVVLSSTLVAAIAGSLAGGLVLRRMLLPNYLSAVIDTAIAIVLPGAVCILVLVAAYLAGTPLDVMPFLFWLPSTGIFGVVLGIQAGLIFGVLMSLITRRPFLSTAFTSALGVFLSVLATGCIFYFFQLGGFMLDLLTGRTGPLLGPTARGIWGAFPGFVLLCVPGFLLCWSALGLSGRPYSGWSRAIACLVLVPVNNFIYLNAIRIVY